ncbi:MAG TPA: redox-sensing transcriptional repressor Rex [bacterium]|nr:redox-sensing transcriptional repressor Rex [bacterium]HOL35023.1 redox-sensing transcriptional repressor Rex [bacterium]HPP08635.1 redox-sensing transcriptional repressor Rex [bacterium]
MGRKKIRKIPQETIRRMALYLRSLKKLKEQKFQIISSNKITAYLNVSPDQFRKDLSYFGPVGKPGVGYRVNNLIHHLEKILGIDRECRIILVGVGKLGSALLGYPGFLNFNFTIVAAFDSDKEKIGKIIGHVKIYDVSEMAKIVPRLGVQLAILTVPAENAQQVAEKLVSCGIRGILNFAPVNLNLSQTIRVLNVDMATELMTLTYFAKKILAG